MKKKRKEAVYIPNSGGEYSLNERGFSWLLNNPKVLEQRKLEVLRQKQLSKKKK